MSLAEELPHVDFADFLAAEHASPERHELVGGRVYVMSGGRERHALMTTLLTEALFPGALAAGCRRFAADRLIRLDASAYYPDLLIVYGPAGDDYYETDADLVVEVLSPSTRDIDRREKATAYAGAASLRQYLLVDPDERRIEVGEPSAGGLRWRVYGPESVLVTRFGTLVLAELYDSLDRLATHR